MFIHSAKFPIILSEDKVIFTHLRTKNNMLTNGQRGCQSIFSWRFYLISKYFKFRHCSVLILHRIYQCISSFCPGPISSILVNRFGSRPIIIVGGCLAGSGLVSASFCNTVVELYFFIGVVGGQYFTCSCCAVYPSYMLFWIAVFWKTKLMLTSFCMSILCCPVDGKWFVNETAHFKACGLFWVTGHNFWKNTLLLSFQMYFFGCFEQHKWSASTHTKAIEMISRTA